MSIVYGNGINDMPRGWTSENKRNYKIYRTWQSMLARCYSEKYQERHPTYKDCSVCDRWLYLSNFIEDFESIDGYAEEKFLNGELELDKDLKSNGNNHKYSLENCTWISHIENVKQAMKTRNYSNMKGENNPMYGKHGKDNPLSIKIAQYDKNENLIKIWDSTMDIERELKIANQSIITCCKFWEIGCNKEEWFETHKRAPRKKAGGYIWRYYKKDD